MLNEFQRKLATSNTYLIDRKYVSGRIIEYDIRRANSTILFKYNKIDQDLYNYLNNVDKNIREVTIGKMIREDKEIDKIIKKGIIEAKKQLFEANNIQPHEVIRIANDAVYVNRSMNLQYTDFDIVHFAQKSISNSFLNLNKYLFFINYDNNQIGVDIKGIGENQILHQDYLISIIVNIICTLEFNSIKEAIKQLNLFIDDYVNLRLDVGFYREFNPESKFRLKPFIKYTRFSFLSDFVDQNEISSIDISYNLYILRELMSILFQIYQSVYRK